MAFESDAPAIVMLASVQKGFSGCSQYFPTATGETVDCGGWVVSNVGQPDLALDVGPKAAAAAASYELRVLEIERPASMGGGKRRTTHCKYNRWPNYGVPDDAADFAAFAYAVDAIRQQARVRGNDGGASVADSGQEGPLLVHCSGGIGRSGAFIASHCAWSNHCASMSTSSISSASSHAVAVRAAPSLLPYATVLREQRHPWCIEGEHQYTFAYDVFAELLSLSAAAAGEGEAVPQEP